MPAYERMTGPESGVDREGQDWTGRRVLIAGLGKSGQAAAELLSRRGAALVAADSRAQSLPAQARQALQDLGIRIAPLDSNVPELVGAADVIVVSPGVPETHPLFACAETAGKAVISEIELAYKFCPSAIVAVTGTNGKSSAVTLITEILLDAGRHAVACGNLGIPFSAVVDELTADSIAVVEVSSFQLSHCYTFRPSVAVLLNLGANHLDRHGDIESYHRAKARLFQAQEARDWLVLNADDPLVARYAGAAAADKIWYGRQANGHGAHLLDAVTKKNLDPIAQMALQVSRVLGVPDPWAWQTIRKFRGLEHRIELVENICGRNFINDAKSTTPESTLFAIDRVRGELVVILGGRSKGLDCAALAQALCAKRVIGVVLLGESREALAADCLAAGVAPERLAAADSLEKAVEAAWNLSKPGVSILFSPAHTSFDMFRDFEERGRVFKKLVHQLAGRAATAGGNGYG